MLFRLVVLFAVGVIAATITEVFTPSRIKGTSANPTVSTEVKAPPLLTQEEVQVVLGDPHWVLRAIQRASVAGVGHLTAGVYENDRLGQAIVLGVELYPSETLAGAAYAARRSSGRVRWGVEAQGVVCGSFQDYLGRGHVCLGRPFVWRAKGLFGLVWAWSYTSPPTALYRAVQAQGAKLREEEERD